MLTSTSKIEQIQKKTESLIKELQETKKPFSGPYNKDARQALQTFFRSSFRVQMGMIGLADRKANILVRLNSLLISGMVIFYKNITSYNDMATISVVLFLLTLVVSLIFATLAVRPSAEDIHHNGDPDLDKSVGHMFMYTHYVDMSPSQFEKTFDTMMGDAGLIYGSMARDLYQFGKIIVKKYQLLRIAYTTFTIGLVITVVLFLASILLV